MTADWIRDPLFDLDSSQVAYVANVDPSLTIPMSEKLNQEFESSFQFNYKKAEFRGSGNKQAAPSEKARVNKNNSGKGLEYDVAKAMVGMVNSNHNVERV